MKLLTLIIHIFITCAGLFIVCAMMDVPMLTCAIIAGVNAILSIIANIVLRVRAFDGVVHIDDSNETIVIQLEFCADPRRFTNKDELIFRVDTETKLAPGRRSNNELVKKALDEIEEFH